MEIKLIVFLTAFSLATYCQTNAFNFMGLPRYLASLALWRLERGGQSTENDLSPLHQEPLYSQEFHYAPSQYHLDSKKHLIQETTSMKEQFNNIEQGFIQLKNLFKMSNDEWQKLKNNRKQEKSTKTGFFWYADFFFS